MAYSATGLVEKEKIDGGVTFGAAAAPITLIRRRKETGWTSPVKGCNVKVTYGKKKKGLPL